MRVLLIIVLLLLFSCGSGDFTGGATSESTNGIVVMTSSGEPAHGALAQVVEGAEWLHAIEADESPVSQELLADSVGVIYPSETNGYRAIYVRYGDESGVVSQTTDTLFLTKQVSIFGRSEGETVYITGTPYTSPVVNGTFQFDNVPLGRYSFYVKRSEKLLPTDIFNLTSDTVLDAVTAERLLFDDFQEGFDNSPLKPISSSLQWYLSSDSTCQTYKDSQWINLDPSEGGSSDVSAEVVDGAVKVLAYLGKKAQYPYAGIGIGIRGKSNSSGYDLSDMSSVLIRARGTGISRFSLKSKSIIDAELSPHGYEMELTTDWQNFEIHVDSLHLLASDKEHEAMYQWSLVSSDIMHLQFLWRSANNVTDSSYWIEIDYIYFNGVRTPF